MSKCNAPVVILVAVWLCLALGSSAFGARLLYATIQVDGQTVLRSSYQDNGYPGPATVWTYLGKEPMWVETETQILADATDPVKAKLRGNLVIRLQHVNRLIVEARATELTLIRADAASDKWFLSAEEVQRLAPAHSIPAAPSPGLFERVRARPGISIAIVLIVVSVSAWLLIARRRQPASD